MPEKRAHKIDIPSIFDLEKTPEGKVVMPFNPADYGEDNNILRQCSECENEYPQGEMKELNMERNALFSGAETKQIYKGGVFFCRECWTTSEYSDASKWVA